MPFPESFNDGPIPSSADREADTREFFAGGPQLFQSDLPESLL